MTTSDTCAVCCSRCTGDRARTARKTSRTDSRLFFGQLVSPTFKFRLFQKPRSSTILRYSCIGRLYDDKIINIFQGIDALTTKSGLVQLSRELKYLSVDAAELMPASYLLSDAADIRNFVDEFRLQAVVSMLQVCIISLKTSDTVHYSNFS